MVVYPCHMGTEQPEHIRGHWVVGGILIVPHQWLAYKYSGLFLEAIQVETYERAIHQWLADGDLPEAIIFPTCMLAAVFQRVMLEQGLRCPEDLSMVCFDEDVFVSMCSTAPTTRSDSPIPPITFR